MERHLPFRDFEVCFQAGAETMWWSLTGKPKFGAQRVFEGYRGVGSDITHVKRANDRARFLAGASDLLASSLDQTATLDSLVRLAVPGFADWCVVHLAEPIAGRRLHTAGYEGWTISRYRQTSGRTPEGDPELILEDMDTDGVDVQVMHPNLSLFGLYSDDHELSIAHARVYNDYVSERFTPYFSRLAPTAPVPLTDIDEAVVEIERVAAAGFRAILLPATPPKPYYSRDFDPVWAAAQANGVHVFIHTQTGGVKVNDPASTTLRVVMESAAQVNLPMTEKSAGTRLPARRTALMPPSASRSLANSAAVAPASSRFIVAAPPPSGVNMVCST